MFYIALIFEINIMKKFFFLLFFDS